MFLGKACRKRNRRTSKDYAVDIRVERRQREESARARRELTCTEEERIRRTRPTKGAGDPNADNKTQVQDNVKTR